MREPKYEHFFNKRGLNFDYRESVAFSDIDIQGSRHNKARLEGELLPWLVERYAADMLDEAPFPAIVAFSAPKNGKLSLATGNHRVAACEQNGLDVYPYGCYILEVTDNATKDMITREMNQVEGYTINDAAAIQHALYGVLVHGYQAKDMAERFGIKETRLLQELAVDRVITRLEASGVRSHRNVPRTTLGRLTAVRSDKVLPAVVTLVEDAALPMNEVENLLREVNPLRSEEAQLTVVNNWRERPEIIQRIQATSGGRKRAPRAFTEVQRMKSFFGLSLHWATMANEHQVHINDTDRAHLQLQWAKLNQQLITLLGPAPNGIVTTEKAAAMVGKG